MCGSNMVSPRMGLRSSVFTVSTNYLIYVVQSPNMPTCQVIELKINHGLIWVRPRPIRKITIENVCVSEGVGTGQEEEEYAGLGF